jgi:hypothetical protein
MASGIFKVIKTIVAKLSDEDKKPPKPIPQAVRKMAVAMECTHCSCPRFVRNSSVSSGNVCECSHHRLHHNQVMRTPRGTTVRPKAKSGRKKGRRGGSGSPSPRRRAAGDGAASLGYIADTVSLQPPGSPTGSKDAGSQAGGSDSGSHAGSPVRSSVDGGGEGVDGAGDAGEEGGSDGDSSGGDAEKSQADGASGGDSDGAGTAR